MIDKKLGYDLKTQELIDRMCRYVERKDYVLNKKVAEEKILKTYDLFGLPRPKKVVWCKDPFDERFARSARSAGSAGSAGSAWSAWSAGSARSARSAGSAWSAGSAGSAGSAWSAGSARSARSAGSAGSARSAGSAWSAWSAGSAGSADYFYWTGLDYDFDWYVQEFEYCLNPDSDRLPNENDKIYLKYSELLLEALEAGLGLRVEWEDVLYLVPIAVVRIDELNRFHSTKEPAIRWKGGKEFYYLHGINFEKKWWTKVVKDKLSPEEIFAIDNLEHRRIAYEFMDKTKMKSLKDYKVLDEVKDDGYGYPMKIISFTVKNVDEPLKYLNVFCPSTGREYFIGTKYEKCLEAKAQSFGFEEIEFIKEW